MGVTAISALKDLKEKLDGAREDLDVIVADFNKVVALRHSLQAADTSLKTASDNVAEMASALKGDALALEQCVTSLAKAADVIASIDPSEVKQTYARIEGRVARLEEAAERIDKGVAAAATRETVVLTLLAVLLLVTTLTLFFATGSRNTNQAALAPSPTLALRGSISGEPSAAPISSPDFMIEPRFAVLCSPPGTDEAISCGVTVTDARHGYGFRSKGENT